MSRFLFVWGLFIVWQAEIARGRGFVVLTSKEQELLDALSPRASKENVEIVTIEVVGSKKAPTIRVYIDTENGVSFDELTSAQVWINDIMDKLDPFPGAYTLEVSSPGIDRPLRTPDHFRAQQGNTVVVKTKQQIEGKTSFTGTVASVEDDAVVLGCDGTEVRVSFDAMKRAHLKGEIDFSS